MSYFVRKSNNKYKAKKEYTCQQCGILFTPTHHGNTKKFCSHLCANRNKWAKYKENLLINPKPRLTKKCIHCGNEFEINKGMSANSRSWIKAKYCSRKCVAQSNKINDGLTNAQRVALRKGTKKRGTAEWLEMIKTRTKEAMQREDVKKKISNPKPKWSLERKISHSDKLVGKIPKNLGFGGGAFPNVKRGTYFCSKGDFYFRSKWEANYALYLDFLVRNGDIESWDYEVDTFIFHQIQFGTRSYTPDFKITNIDKTTEYHEIKGYMTPRSKTQIKRMAKYYPEIKLVLIDAKPYNEIIKKLKGIIKFN